MTILSNIFTTALWSQLGALLWQLIQLFTGTTAVLVLMLASTGCCCTMQFGWKNKPCEVPATAPAADEKPASDPAIVDTRP